MIRILLCLCLAIMLAGCGGSDSPSGSTKTAVPKEKKAEKTVDPRYCDAVKKLNDNIRTQRGKFNLPPATHRVNADLAKTARDSSPDADSRELHAAIERTERILSVPGVSTPEQRTQSRADFDYIAKNYGPALKPQDQQLCKTNLKF